MKLAIMQPYFFPYMGYFQLIQAVDKFMLYENVSFRAKTWITRNYILPKDGNLLTINLPVARKNSFKPINDIEIANCEKWKKNLINKLYYTYKKAEHFEEIFLLLTRIIHFDTNKVHDFNSNLIIELCRYLEILTKITYNHSNYLDMENKLADEFNRITDIQTKTSDILLDKKTARIIAICKKERADAYYNPISGNQLYFKKDFYDNGIELSFIEMKQISYHQFNELFVPNLSIIDVLMHNGKIRTKNLLNQFEII